MGDSGCCAVCFPKASIFYCTISDALEEIILRLKKRRPDLFAATKIDITHNIQSIMGDSELACTVFFHSCFDYFAQFDTINKKSEGFCLWIFLRQINL